MQQEITIFERGGVYCLLKIHGKFVANFKPNYVPNILIVEFLDDNVAKKEYNSAVNKSTGEFWKVVWVGQPNYG